MISNDALWLLWGKTSSQGDRTVTHPLICHMLDVGEIAGAIWDRSLAQGLRCWFTDLLQVDQATCRGLLCAWAALHDLGKAAPNFQRKYADAIDVLTAAGLTFPRSFGQDTIYHGEVSAWCLTEEFIRRSLLPTAHAVELATVLGGHHGTWRTIRTRLSRRDTGDDAWQSVRSELIDVIFRQYSIANAWRLPDDDGVRHGLLATLAGLVSVSDWIASMAERFSAAPDTRDLDSYVRDAGHKAHTTIQNLGWSRWCPPSDSLPFDEMFSFAPNAMQREVINFAQDLNEPALVIIEAPTGIGKTEAALFLADHWASTLQQRGLYVAMPTMATSNQMHQRVTNVVRNRYSEADLTPLLVHGQALWRDLPAVGQRTDGGHDLDAMSWFLPRKRSLLAPLGVGTVDQSLLSVLVARHFFVRMFGLAGKTVVFDEVHAYDTYMSELFARLLAWLRRQNTSVVILSATLPETSRLALLEAWGVSSQDVPTMTYPAVTATTGDNVTCCPLPVEATREVTIEWLDREPEQMADKVAQAITEGGCVVVVCNTVGRAQQVYRVLRNMAICDSDMLTLFHARFPQAWRERIERTVLNRFGKNSVRPHRAVVVATQVVEQSLDLDFDLMITDVAPVDLLLQRAGRLHRHPRIDQRPATFRVPRLVLIAPVLANGVPEWGVDAYVYDPYILLRTYLALQERERLELPTDTQSLIEAVYGTKQHPDDPVMARALKEAYEQMIHRYEKDRAQAQLRLVPHPEDELAMSSHGSARDPDDPSVHRDMQAFTRLGPPSISLICLHDRRGTLFTEAHGGVPVRLDEEPDNDVARELARHSVSVTHRGVYAYYCEQPVPSGWRRHPFLRHCRAAVFTDEQCWCEGTGYHLYLSRDLGLVIEREAR